VKKGEILKSVYIRSENEFLFQNVTIKMLSGDYKNRNALMEHYFRAWSPARCAPPTRRRQRPAADGSIFNRND